MKLSLTVLTAVVAFCNASTLQRRAECAAGTRVINGRTCTISCGVDRPGGDYDRSRTGTFEACIQACAADSRCITAQYHEDNKFCYFKNTKNKAVAVALDDTVDCDAAPLPNGATCKTDSDCQSNHCNPSSGGGASTCGLGPDGSSCSDSSQCLSGYCNASKLCAYPTLPDGSGCYYNKDCDSNFCRSDHKCGKIAVNDRTTTCGQDLDCANGICNSYTRTCGKDYSGCFQNRECSTNVCTAEFRCGPLNDGQTCYRSSDCTGKYCNLGNGNYGQSYCGLGRSGAGCTRDDQCKSGSCDTSAKQCA